MATSNLEILAYEPCAIGMICLRQRELLSEPGTVVTEITLDHALLMSSCNVASEEALARSALDLHGGAELEVLVGGLGLGHTAAEALRSECVARVETVEFVPQVTSWLERGLLPLAAGLRADPRFSVRPGDVYALLRAAPERRHDVVLVDVDHSPEETLGDTNDSFYTAAGLERAKRHLRPGGVLGVWSYAESPAFEAELRRAFDVVRVEPVTFWNRLVQEEETNHLYLGRA